MGSWNSDLLVGLPLVGFSLRKFLVEESDDAAILTWFTLLLRCCSERFGQTRQCGFEQDRSEERFHQECSEEVENAFWRKL